MGGVGGSTAIAQDLPSWEPAERFLQKPKVVTVTGGGG